MQISSLAARGALEAGVGRPRPWLGRAGLKAATNRVGGLVVFGLLPALATVALIAITFGKGSLLYDFHGGLYQAGRDVLHGHSPYRPAYLALQAAIQRAGGAPATVIDVPVYPAPILLAVVPFALLPYHVAALVFTALSVAGLLLALRLLGVRDWRCYGVAFCYWPVLSGLRLGAVSPLLVLGAAIVWRRRDDLRACTTALAAVIVAKLFPWTLAVWLVFTRRWRALLMTAGLAAALTLGAWAAIDFRGLSEYPAMLSNLSSVSAPVGVSAVSGALALGASTAPALALADALAAGLLALAWRASREPGGEGRAFGLIVIAALTASPMVWPHYLALLVIPIALLSPRLSPIWFVPLVAYVAPIDQTGAAKWEVLPYLVIEALVVWRLVRPVEPACR